ncbi:hypothetical protein [Halobacteriovorax sp. DPLXC-1]|uniref:hypothetical protein n=1 Tax=Halobacteriovorax sp. DPLXC-1 TaxID=3110771 RepID=UPI002FF00EB5
MKNHLKLAVVTTLILSNSVIASNYRYTCSIWHSAEKVEKTFLKKWDQVNYVSTDTCWLGEIDLYVPEMNQERNIICGNTFDGENFQLKINAKRYDNNAMIISYEIGRNDYSGIVNLAKQEVSLDADYFQYNSAADDSFANYVLSNSKKHESRVTAVSLVCDKI